MSDGKSPPELSEVRSGPARLVVSDLSVEFGGLLAVDDVSFTAEPGSIVGLIGPNGSGKTTTLDAISGFVRTASGSITLDGLSLGGYLPEERRGIGMIRSFQDCRLFPELSVEDVLLCNEDAEQPFGVISATLQMPWARRKEREKRAAVARAVDAFGLGPFVHHRIAELSTGTRHVVDLASILLADPRILLLDEPTAGIAQREAEAFIPLLRQLQQVTNTTVVIVEHDVPLIFALCTQVVVLETGRVVSIGTPDEVGRDPRALAAYLGASDAALAVSGPTAQALVRRDERKA